MSAKTILVYESSADALDTLTQELTARGYDIAIAEVGPSPIEAFESHQPELVFIDLRATGAIDVCQTIRDNPDGAIVPILFIGSGEEEVASASDALTFGGDYFFELPLVLERVTAKVQTYVGPGTSDSDKPASSLAAQPIEEAIKQEKMLASLVEDEPTKLGTPDLPDPPAMDPTVDDDSATRSLKKASDKLLDQLRAIDQDDQDQTMEQPAAAPATPPEDDSSSRQAQAEAEAEAKAEAEAERQGDLKREAREAEEREQELQRQAEADARRREEEIRREADARARALEEEVQRRAEEEIQRRLAEQRDKERRDQEERDRLLREREERDRILREEEARLREEEERRRKEEEERERREEDRRRQEAEKREEERLRKIEEEEIRREQERADAEERTRAVEEERLAAKILEEERLRETRYTEPNLGSPADDDVITAARREAIAEARRRQSTDLERRRISDERNEEQRIRERVEEEIRQRLAAEGIEAEPEAHGDGVLSPRTGSFDVTNDIADVLARAFRQNVDGRIEFSSDQRQKTVFFEAGRPVDAFSSQVFDRMEEYLYREGRITRAQYQEVRVKGLRGPRKIGSYLVTEGFIKPEELFSSVRGHLEEVLFGLFEWEAGEFTFSKDSVEEDERVTLDRDPRALILEGVRRKYLLHRLMKRIGAPSTLVAKTVGVHIDANALELTANERKLLPLIDGTRSIEDLVFSSGIDAINIYHILSGLMSMDAIQVLVKGIEGISEDGSSPSDDIDRERIREKLEQVRTQDYFKILGVSSNATSYEIDRACERIVREYELERFSERIKRDCEMDIREITNVLEDARQVLRDDAVRDAYARHSRPVPS